MDLLKQLYVLPNNSQQSPAWCQSHPGLWCVSWPAPRSHQQRGSLRCRSHPRNDSLHWHSGRRWTAWKANRERLHEQTLWQKMIGHSCDNSTMTTVKNDKNDARISPLYHSYFYNDDNHYQTISLCHPYYHNNNNYYKIITRRMWRRRGRGTTTTITTCASSSIQPQPIHTGSPNREWQQDDWNNSQNG